MCKGVSKKDCVSEGVLRCAREGVGWWMRERRWNERMCEDGALTIPALAESIFEVYD